MPVRVPSCRRTSVASPFFQERAATRVALEAPPRRGHPRHAVSAVRERVPSCRVCCWRDRGLPRAAPSCSALSVRRASSPVSWPWRRFGLHNGENAVAETAHPSAKAEPRLPAVAGARERARLSGVQGPQPRHGVSGRAAAVTRFDL
jgi:hypothetical protein